jgi:transmembrane sensor
MTDDINATPSRDQLRQEAADWFAIMRGPEAEKRGRVPELAGSQQGA